jgi:hypothetical protein
MWCYWIHYETHWIYEAWRLIKATKWKIIHSGPDLNSCPDSETYLSTVFTQHFWSHDVILLIFSQQNVERCIPYVPTSVTCPAFRKILDFCDLRSKKLLIPPYFPSPVTVLFSNNQTPFSRLYIVHVNFLLYLHIVDQLFYVMNFKTRCFLTFHWTETYTRTCYI